MKPTVEIRTKSSLTSEEYNRIETLRLKNGLLWDFFLENHGGMCILVKVDDLIVSWGFLFLDDLDDEDSFQLHCYTSRYHRRKGYGTLVVEEAIKIAGEVEISKWNEQAAAFYDNFENVQEI